MELALPMALGVLGYLVRGRARGGDLAGVVWLVGVPSLRSDDLMVLRLTLALLMSELVGWLLGALYSRSGGMINEWV